ARVKPGTKLYTNRPRPFFTVMKDTSSGKHDLLFAACTAEFYKYYGGEDSHSNCHDNFIKALTPYGMRAEDLPNPVNLFQYSEVSQDGEIRTGDPGAAAGEYVELRAEINAIIAVS